MTSYKRKKETKEPVRKRKETDSVRWIHLQWVASKMRERTTSQGLWELRPALSLQSAKRYAP